MPIQAPQWTDYLNCPICLKKYGEGVLPVNLGCGHSGCEHCVFHLSTQECPFDQVPFTLNPSNRVLNTAIMQLVGLAIPDEPQRPPMIAKLTYGTQLHYDTIVQKFEEFARYLPHPGYTSKLSNPMQKKIVQLIHCTVLDCDARKKVLRTIRNLADRTINEILLLHQNPQQLGPNLWAAVRARGCQFLGPAMQEEVLQLVLLALEDGSQLSRRVLVMFVVQKLEPRFPHVSKTSIGHVVQLLYRASCFTVFNENGGMVSKRDSSSSLMQLKEEYRTYDSLRREHDAQIVQIAQEAGLRIAPDQWSSLLYGDSSYKSHMQSIMDRLYSLQAFHQATKELVILYKRLGWEARSEKMSKSLKTLCSLDELLVNLEEAEKSNLILRSNFDDLFERLEGQKDGDKRRHAGPTRPVTVTHRPEPQKQTNDKHHSKDCIFIVGDEYSRDLEKEKLPSFEHLAYAAKSFGKLLYDLVNHDEIRKTHQDSTAQDSGEQTFNTRVYKNSMCYYIRSGKPCFRGKSCYYAHSAEELERLRNRKKNNDPAPKHTTASGSTVPQIPSTSQSSPSTSTNCEPGPDACTFEPSPSESTLESSASDSASKAGASDCTSTATSEPGPTACSSTFRAGPHSSLGVISVHSGSDDSDERESVDTMSTARVDPPNSPIVGAVRPTFIRSTTARAFPPNFTNSSSTATPIPPNFNSSSRAGPYSNEGLLSIAIDGDESVDEPDTIDATISNIRDSMYILRRPETAREIMAAHFAAEQLCREEVERGQHYYASSATPAPVPPLRQPLASAPSLYQVENPFNTPIIVRLPLPHRREDPYMSAGFPRFAHPPPPPYSSFEVPPPYSSFEAPPPYQSNQASPPMMPTTFGMRPERNFPERQPYTPQFFNQPDPEREYLEPAPSFPPPRPFQPSSQRDNFIRSFSILTSESDHVPFDQGPSTSYGPISRTPIDPTLTEPGCCNAVSDASQQSTLNKPSATVTTSHQQQTKETNSVPNKP